jgi:general secretion pathway protein M
MIAALQSWWQGRSEREQVLLGSMLGLLLLCIGWFGIWDTAQAGRVAAEGRLAQAVLARDSAKSQIEWLKANESLPAGTAQLVDVVTGSANEIGFVLLRAQSEGPNRLTVEIASARTQALFAWLAQLNERHIFAETADLTPKSDGALSVKLILRQAQ